LIYVLLHRVIFHLPHYLPTYSLPRWLNGSYPQFHNEYEIAHQPFESLEVALCSALTSLQATSAVSLSASLHRLPQVVQTSAIYAPAVIPDEASLTYIARQ